MRPSRFQKLRRIAQSDPIGLDQAIAAGLGEAQSRFVEARAWEASYFADCPRVPAGGEPHPGACEPSDGGGMPDGRGMDHFKKIDPARDKVDGRDVRDGPVPNTDSIASSFTDYEVLPGIREIPMTDFDVKSLHSWFYAADDFDRVGALAEKIRQSGEITPLIVAVDKDGPYVLEGGHRLGALWTLKAKSFPAIVVLDLDESPKKEARYRGTSGNILREAQAPRTKAKLDAKKRPAVADVVADMGDNFDDLAGELMDGEGPNPLLAAQIDRNLGIGIWTGSTFEDRTTHAVEGFARNLVSDIETSLLAQESYGDFEARLFKKMGIQDSNRNLGTLAQFDTLIRGEANLAWNEAMIAANANTDTALAWECRLSPTSTPGCIWRHGRTIDELGGETPILHYGCQCSVTTIPDPDSDDPARAEAGRAVLSQMAAEREEAGGGDEFEESQRPSRFAGLRRLAEADSYFKDCPRVPAGDTSGHPGSCQPEGGGYTGGTPEFNRWFGNSRVVDDAGEPLTVYHVSPAQFDEFKAKSYGTAGEHEYFYFAKAAGWANRFAKDQQIDGKVGAFNLALNKPLDMRDTFALTPLGWREWATELGIEIGPGLTQKLNRAPAHEEIPSWSFFRFDTPGMGNLRAQLLSKGYDGLILNDVVRGRSDNTTYVAFRPQQIKSTKNRGTFDPKSPKINEATRPSRFMGLREIAAGHDRAH